MKIYTSHYVVNLKMLKKKVKIFSKKIEDINNTYDTICYFDVLEHIEDHEKEIKML